MQNIERRLTALEAKASAIYASLKVVFVDDGETEADAMKRSGYAPDAANVMCVVFVSQTDERL